MNPALARLRPWLVFAGLLLLAFGTWRSFPVQAGEETGREPLRVVLFDLSAGTTRLRPGHSLWARARLREQAQAAESAGEELALVVYGRDLVSRGTASAAEWLARLAGRDGELLELTLDARGSVGSNLDGALALFEAELCDLRRPRAELVIGGLRDYSGDDPRPRLARLAQAGVRIEWLDVPDARLVDVGLESLRLPAQPAVGEPLLAEVQLSLVGARRFAKRRAQGVQVQLQLQVENAHGVQHLLRILDVPQPQDAGGDLIQWSARVPLGACAEGRTALLAKVTLIDGARRVLPDAMGENDGASARCRAGRKLVVAAVAPRTEHANVRGWIGNDPARWPGIQWLLLEPSELSAVLGELDVLVSVELGPADLPAALVEGFVRGGGGWFFCAGFESLAGWFREPGVAASGLNALLPLHPAPGGGAPRDVIVLVDGSGSMQGQPFERVREALAGLVLSVPPEDALRLHFFTGTLRPPVNLRSAQGGAEAAVRRLFDARLPGGPTAILYSLEVLAQERSGGTREALVILLTDGKEVNSSNVTERSAFLRSELNRGESRLVVIAAGDDPNLWLLSTLAGEGELHVAGDLESLSEIFHREVFARRVRAGSFAMLPAESGRLAESKDLLAAWNSLGSPWPEVERYLRCEASADADVLVSDASQREPQLAWRRVGRGKVCAWASAPLPAWAERYSTQDARLAALLRSLASVRTETASLRAAWVQGRVEVSNVPLVWPAELEATYRAQLPGALVATRQMEVELARGSLRYGPARPGEDPRLTRVGDLPTALLERALRAPLHLDLRDPRDGEWLGLVGLDLPCSAEFRRAGSPLVDLAELPSASPARGASDPQPDPRAWIWILAGICILSSAGLLGALGKTA